MSMRLIVPPRLAIAVLLVGLLVGGIWLAALRWPARPTLPREDDSSDPRLTYSGPYLNVAPSVRYVGDSSCAECHPDYVRHFSQHPMGRSMRAVTPGDQPPGKSFTALGLRFEVNLREGRMLHRATLPTSEDRSAIELALPAEYLIGSGARGHSYLTFRDGQALQTPISYYTRKGQWDLSPGFTAELIPGRPVPATCLYCHSNGAAVRPGESDKFEADPFPHGASIGCERCHGPAELHVEMPTAGNIVNPRKLPWRLRDAVCEQCHLEGQLRLVRRGRELDDFRPGLPLESCWAVYVESSGGANSRAVNHVEQMRQSRCFLNSPEEKKLGCISCHDPHEKPTKEARVEHFRSRCLNCHQSKGCSIAEAERRREVPGDSCIECHMPRYDSSDIPHNAATDHRIPRRSNREELPSPSKGELTRFHPVAADDVVEERRDRGIALIRRLFKGKGDQRRDLALALPLLEAAVATDPNDDEAWVTKGQALILTGQSEAGLAAFETVLERHPRHQLALAGAARTAQALGKADLTLDAWKRLAKAYPHSPGYGDNLATLLSARGRWAEASEEAENWVRRDPFSVLARQLLIRCLLQQGKTDKAKSQFDILRRLLPEKREELEAWFASQTR